MDREYWHPERHCKYMTFLPGKDTPPGNRPGPTKEQLAELATVKSYPDSTEEDEKELCHSCGWAVSHESSSYESRVKILRARDNIGWWALDSKLILIDRINNPETLGNDLMTQEFLRKQPGCNIPLLREMKCLSQPTDKVQFTVMSRAEGVTLQSIWIGECIKELRKFTSPVAQKVDGTPLDDIILGVCTDRAPYCKKIGSTGHEWIDNLAEEIRDGLAKAHKTNDPELVEKKFQELKDRFPDQGPYVLTHTDLAPTNIMVKDGKIEAIIDWEWAGYYPWWVERLRSWGFHCSQAELFEPLWDTFDGEMNQEAFDEWLKPVLEVRGLFGRCRKDHPGLDGCWKRPAFCKCQRYGGIMHMRALGQPTGHRLRNKGYDPDEEARRAKLWPDPDEEIDGKSGKQKQETKASWAFWRS